MSINVQSMRSADLSAPATHGIVATAWPFVRALLRWGTGLLFMQHGLQKLFGMLGGVGPTGGTVPLMSLMGLAGVLEFVGGLMIVLGLLTRPVAFLLMGEMVVAYFKAHMPQGGAPVQNGGELALLYALVFAFLAVDGAGPMSIDSAMRKSRHGPEVEPRK